MPPRTRDALVRFPAVAALRGVSEEDVAILRPSLVEADDVQVGNALHDLGVRLGVVLPENGLDFVLKIENHTGGHEGWLYKASAMTLPHGQGQQFWWRPAANTTYPLGDMHLQWRARSVSLPLIPLLLM